MVVALKFSGKLKSKSARIDELEALQAQLHLRLDRAEAARDKTNIFASFALELVTKQEHETVNYVVSFRSRLSLPPVPKCPVELHETLIFVASRLRQREFRGEKRPLAVQHFEIGRGTALVARDGEAD